MADAREKAIQDYRKKLLEHKELDARLKEGKYFWGYSNVLCVH